MRQVVFHSERESCRDPTPLPFFSRHRHELVVTTKKQKTFDGGAYLAPYTFDNAPDGRRIQMGATPAGDDTLLRTYWNNQAAGG